MTIIRFVFLHFFIFSNLYIAYSQRWEIVSSKPLPSNMGFNGLSVVDKNTVWLAANDYSLWGVNGGSSIDPSHLIRIMKTTDGGKSWNIFEVPEAKGRATLEICALDSLTAWFSTNQFINTDTRPIFKTKDGGRTWKKVETPSMAGGNIIHFFDHNDGILVNGTVAATSQDGGETWKQIPGITYNLQIGEFLLVIGSATSRAAYTDSMMVFGTSRGRIFYTKDRGKSFSVKQVGTVNDLLNAITILDSKHWIVIAPQSNQVYNNNPKVFQTLDGGNTWDELTRAQNRITHVAKLPGTPKTVFTCSLTRNGIKASKTGFENPDWEETLQGELYAYGIAFSKDGVGYAVTGDRNEENFIVKWSNVASGTDITSSDDISVKIFPNPFSDYLTFQLPPNAGDITRISVFGRSGEKILQKADYHNNMISFQDWPKGIYFVKIETNQSIFTKRIIKI